ncbi:MAG: cytochrome [Bradyrhizobium sp.]|nr:cytochrome [Bradyrhizobium sp.]
MGEEADITALAAGFNLHDGLIMQQPYLIYDRLRATCPVAHSDHHGGYAFATSFAAVKEIYSNFRTFSSAQGASLPSHPLRLLPLEVDPPLQTKYRRLINPLFTVEAVERKRAEIVRVANGLIDDLIERGDADLINDLVRPALAAVVLPMLGVLTTDQKHVSILIEWITLGRSEDMARVERAFEELIDYLAGLVARRRGEARIDDLIGTLITATIDAWPVTDDEIVRILIVTLLGGLDTTTAVMGEALLHLARNPDDARALLSGELTWATAIEEFIRFTAPVQGMRRVVLRETSLEGVTLTTGESVIALNGAANRDPGKYAEPNRCILDRENNDHLSFGAGAHICLGRNLARLEIEIMLDLILRRIPDMSIAADFVPTYTVSEARGMTALPIRFTAGSPAQVC